MSAQTNLEVCGVPWLEGIDVALRDELVAAARVVPLARGELLSMASQYAFVTDGVIKVARRHPNGRETILHLVPSGGLLLEDSASPVTFVAFSDQSRVLLLRTSDVQRVLSASPQASWTLLSEVRRVYFEARELAGDLAVTPLPRRIAWILARLGRRFGVDAPDGARLIPLPLSRQDIADLSGTTLETAIRVMSRLRREEVVKSAKSGIEIRNPRRIERIATGEEPLRARVR